MGIRISREELDTSDKFEADAKPLFEKAGYIFERTTYSSGAFTLRKKGWFTLNCAKFYIHSFSPITFRLMEDESEAVLPILDTLGEKWNMRGDLVRVL